VRHVSRHFCGTRGKLAAIFFAAAAWWLAAGPARSQTIDISLPSLSQFSIKQTAPPSPLQARVAFSATVNMKQRTNPQVYVDLSGLAVPRGGRLRWGLSCHQQHGSHIWNCDGTAFLTPNHYEAQFVVFFDFSGGMVNGNRSLVTLPVPPVGIDVTGTVGRFPIPTFCNGPHGPPPLCP
jgi:hypothetical protein